MRRLCHLCKLMNLEPQDCVTSELPLTGLGAGVWGRGQAARQEATRTAVQGGAVRPCPLLHMGHRWDRSQASGHLYPEGLGSRVPGPCWFLSARSQCWKLGAMVHPWTPRGLSSHCQASGMCRSRGLPALGPVCTHWAPLCPGRCPWPPQEEPSHGRCGGRSA